MRKFENDDGEDKNGERERDREQTMEVETYQIDVAI